MSKRSRVNKQQTEKKGIQAFVGHVLINQHLFFSCYAATQKPDQVPMLEFRNHYNLILELQYTLPRTS